MIAPKVVVSFNEEFGLRSAHVGKAIDSLSSLLGVSFGLLRVKNSGRLSYSRFIYDVVSVWYAWSTFSGSPYSKSTLNRF